MVGLGVGMTRHLDEFLDEVEAGLEADDNNAIKEAAAKYRKLEATECNSVLWAGPGHQSKWPCERRGYPHHHHHSGYREWSSCQETEEGKAFSSYFDDSEHCFDHEDYPLTDG